MIPTLFPDIPRVYTALAEFFACLIIGLPYLQQLDRRVAIRRILLFLTGQIALQILAGQLPIFFWLVGMAINVLWMFVTIKFFGVPTPKLQFYDTAKAFIAAELVASTSWHIYCITLLASQNNTQYAQIGIMTVFYSLLFLLFYYLNHKISAENIETILEWRDVNTAIFTSIAIFAMSNIGFILSNTRQFQDSTSIFILRTTINLSGILLIFTQEALQYERHLKGELASINSMFQLQYKQYQAYRENSEIISRKVHDLKHQLAVFRQEADKNKQEQYLDEMSKAIQNFEAKVETGNPVLDTILTQKNHYCLSNNINLTCIVNGEILNFMDVMDLSTLIGNAMDNAIEAVEKIANPDQRLITLKISQHSQFVVFRLDNYDISDLHISEDSFPTTSKSDKDFHGFGLKSMEYIVHKYGGNMTFSKVENWVQLKIILPQP